MEMLENKLDENYAKRGELGGRQSAMKALSSDHKGQRKLNAEVMVFSARPRSSH